MRYLPKISKLAVAITAVLTLTSCGLTDNKQPSQTSDQPKKEIGRQNPSDQKKEDPNQSNWVISVKDTSTVNMGSIQSTTTLDLDAKNAGLGITGHYSGTGSGNTVNVNPAYGVTSKAGVENSLQWDFTIDPPLAPLVKPEEDENLAPLTRPEGDPDYEGSGTITISPHTATITGVGATTTKKMDGATYPINIFVIGEKIRLELKSPQGSIFFDGTIQKTNP